MTVYCILKDFAGPVATVIAASAALIVTYRFNSRQIALAASQLKIASTQRDIAIDKLKHDLFDKRYEVYLAAKALIRCAAIYAHEKTPSSEVVDLKVKLDEARFFFPTDIQDLASKIERACEDVMSRIDQRQHLSPDDDGQWGKSGDELANSESALRKLYAELPLLFQRDLQSGLLVGSGTSDGDLV